jgi:hypothetical protein
MKSTKSMSTKKPTLKKYSAGAIVGVDDKDKGKGNKYMNRLNQGINDLGKTIGGKVNEAKEAWENGRKIGRVREQKIINNAKDVYKKVERKLVPHKKGGVVGKSSKK